jgi:hypothetical protein
MNLNNSTTPALLLTFEKMRYFVVLAMVAMAIAAPIKTGRAAEKKGVFLGSKIAFLLLETPMLNYAASWIVPAGSEGDVAS